MRIDSASMPDHVKRLLPSDDPLRCGKAGRTFEECEAERVAASEKQLQENIAALLRQRDIAFFWQRMDRKTTGTVGWPDFTFAVNGRAVALEAKQPGNVPTAEQIRMHVAMMKNGWTVRVVTTERAALDVINEVLGLESFSPKV